MEEALMFFLVFPEERMKMRAALSVFVVATSIAWHHEMRFVAHLGVPHESWYGPADTSIAISSRFDTQ